MNFTYKKNYDVAVIGAGHAGIEASFSASRRGAKVALFTQNLDTIGKMSCNPAIGGIAKGHMVREIDALGGIMAMSADMAGIQFRTLNATRGVSVQSPRAQCDKLLYHANIKNFLEKQKNIDIFQTDIKSLEVKNDKIEGIVTKLDVLFKCKSLVICSGTFLKALMHVGEKQQKGGRSGDVDSNLSVSLKNLGFKTERFKTGTPCRLAGKSIDFTKTKLQPGDTPPLPFSFFPQFYREHFGEQKNFYDGKLFHVEQLPCWVTFTNDKTHKIINNNLRRSALYCGGISGSGPRYCPSIEDKVVKFADKSRHQIFLEPEGRNTDEFYVNGVSTSLPLDVQLDFIHSVAGLENAHITRPGYAVEYDYFPPQQLFQTLETKLIENVFFAGQINGTSGYEEAAGQGLVAGANAAGKVLRLEKLHLARYESYIGVMIDDLTTKGVIEPYRMFTSRAEQRLLLRHNNADLRLRDKAKSTGLLPAEKLAIVDKRAEDLQKLLAKLEQNDFKNCANDANGGVKKIGDVVEWLRQPQNSYVELMRSDAGGVGEDIWQMAEAEIKLAGYIERERKLVERQKREAELRLSANVDYFGIAGLKREAQQRLTEVKPRDLGQAMRVPGVNPSDVLVLSVWLKKQKSGGGG